MLVLKRKVGEVLTCDIGGGRHIVFKVVEVRSHHVRIGIVAPDDVPIERPDAVVRKSETGISEASA